MKGKGGKYYMVNKGGDYHMKGHGKHNGVHHGMGKHEHFGGMYKHHGMGGHEHFDGMLNVLDVTEGPK